MNQRLCIGIQRLNPGWKSILDQAGFWYEEINYLNSLDDQYSVIILNDQIKRFQEKELDIYLSKGGTLLEAGIHPVYNDAKKIKSRRVTTLINESNQAAYQHIPFLDIFSKVYLHNQSSVLEGLIHIEKFKRGHIGFLGADLPSLLNSKGYIRKRFFNPAGKYPNEIVSKVSKHELMQTFTALIKELHVLRKLPGVKKWESPARKPVFCFRVDSDFGDQKAMDNLYEIAAKRNLSLTWFLHVEAHEKWLQHFHSYKKQEIALHGYTHGTSDSWQKTHANTIKGGEILRKEGFTPKGFCAPYGIWNKALIKSLKKVYFTYTSEFTFCYDGFPVQPVEESLPLQIPIHPICTGNLKRQELTISEMSTYFDFVLINKLERFEPVLFYHHPLQTGLKAIDFLFRRVKAEKLTNLTFTKFADFWRKRRDFKFEAFWDGKAMKIKSPTDKEIFLQVFKNHNQFELFPAGDSEFQLSQTPEFEFSKQYLPEPEQVIDMRKKDFKLAKTSLLDWKNRIRL